MNGWGQRFVSELTTSRRLPVITAIIYPLSLLQAASIRSSVTWCSPSGGGRSEADWAIERASGAACAYWFAGLDLPPRLRHRESSRKLAHWSSRLAIWMARHFHSPSPSLPSRRQVPGIRSAVVFNRQATGRGARSPKALQWPVRAPVEQPAPSLRAAPERLHRPLPSNSLP